MKIKIENIVYTALACVGLSLLLWTVQQIGWSVLVARLQEFGVFRLLALTLLYGIWQMCFCLAWWLVIDTQEQHPLSFSNLFKAYLAGDAINMTVPSGNLAGEPVKVMLLKSWIPVPQVIASVTVYKMVDFFSMTLFLLLGWIVHFALYDFPKFWIGSAGLVVLGMSGFSGLILLLQSKGIYGPILKKLSSYQWGQWLEKKMESIHLVDDSIRVFFKQHRSRMYAALGFHFLAWFGGVVEIWLFFKWMNIPGGFFAAWIIETFSLLINNVAFFVPARLGVIEGGRVLLFTTLGFPAAVGLLYGIVRRLREMIWIMIGFMILSIFRRKQHEH